MIKDDSVQENLMINLTPLLPKLRNFEVVYLKGFSKSFYTCGNFSFTHHLLTLPSSDENQGAKCSTDTRLSCAVVDLLQKTCLSLPSLESGKK